MSNLGKPTHLSKNVISKVLTKSETSSELVLQLIKVNKQQAQNSTLTIILSDGCLSIPVICLKEAKEEIANKNPSPFSIMRVSLQNFKGKAIIVMKFNYLDTSINTMIGNPQQIDDIAGFNPENYQIADIEFEIPAQAKKPATARVSRPVVASTRNNNDDDDDYIPIKLLTPGNGGSAMIKARCSTKLPVKNYTNSNGPGKLLSLIFVDKSGEIEATLFNESVDKFQKIFEENEIYVISSFQVKPASRYNRARNSNNSISFMKTTEVTRLDDAEDNSIPKVFLELTPISEIQSKELNQGVDVAGIVVTDPDSTEIRTKKGDMLTKTSFEIADDSEFRVEVTMWGDLEPRNICVKKGEMIVMTNVQVREFQGAKNLSFSYTSKYLSDSKLPDIPEVQRLLVWSKKGGAGAAKELPGDGKVRIGNILNSLRYIHDRGQELSMGGNLDTKLYFSGYATLSTIFSKRLYYDSCSLKTECIKGVSSYETGSDIEYTCDKCGSRLKEPPIPRYMLFLKFVDGTAGLSVSCLNQEIGNDIFGMDATKMKQQLQFNSDSEDAIREYLDQFAFRQMFITVKCHVDDYNDKLQVKYTLIRAFMTEDDDFSKVNTTIRKTIDAYREMYEK